MKLKIDNYFSNHSTGLKGDKDYVRISLDCTDLESGNVLKVKYSTANDPEMEQAVENVIGKEIDIELDEMSGTFNGKSYTFYQEVKDGTVLYDLGLIKRKPRNSGFVKKDKLDFK